MTSEETTATRQLETRVTRLEEGQATLLAATARIESMVENLAGGQKGVYDRMNRPWQWGAVVAAFVAIMSLAGVFGTILNLAISPLEQALLRHHEDDKQFDDRLNAVEAQAAVGERDRYWLEKMTSRYQHQIDMIWDDIRLHHDPSWQGARRQIPHDD